MYREGWLSNLIGDSICLRVSFNLFYFYLYHLSADFVFCSLEVLAGILMWLMEIEG